MTDQPPDAKVGYGNPPREHRFRPKQSGNPKGRPPKKRRLAAADELISVLHQAVLVEGQRSVQVIEGGQTRRLTAIEALLRSILIAAMKGDRHARQEFLRLHEQAESESTDARERSVAAAIKYKLEFGPVAAELEAAGKEWPALMPHPDDIIVDHATMTVQTVGPQSEDHRLAVEAAVEQRNTILKDIHSLERADFEIPLNARKDTLALLRSSLKKLNAALPEELRQIS